MRAPIVAVSRLFLAGACAVVSACASSGAPGSRPQSGAAATPASNAAPANRSVPIPPSIGGFTAGARRVYEDRMAGMSVRYLGPDSLYADLFLYPGPDLATQCNVECARRLIEQEVTQFGLDLNTMIRQGTLQRFNVVHETTIVRDSAAAWELGHHVQVTLARARMTDQRSDYYLYYAPRIRVKVRVTYTETPARTQAVDGFISDLWTKLVVR